MKQLLTAASMLLLALCAMAQAPEKMNYQAVVRNNADQLIVNTQVGMQISVLQGSAVGTTVYAETHAPMTNINGLATLEIGTGTVVNGDFATIDWSNGPYFLQSETDPTGGASYTITSTSQLLSVPYALHAKTAETITGGNNETYSVGDFAQGGVVFWVDETGQHGLVAAIEDQSAGIKWRGGSTNYLTMAGGDEVYAGKMNTSIIISVHTAKDDIDNYAALLCANYKGGDFGDWYLPSFEEVILIYQNRATIDATAVANGGSGFDNTLGYWSSTEYSEVGARLFLFYNGSATASDKTNEYPVRAVRAF